jgi:hypothetical protein
VAAGAGPGSPGVRWPPERRTHDYLVLYFGWDPNKTRGLLTATPALLLKSKRLSVTHFTSK